MLNRATRYIWIGITLLMLLLTLAGGVTAQEGTPAVTPEAVSAAPAATTSSPVLATGGLITPVRHLHSLVRWLVVLAALAAIIKLGLGLAQNASYDDLTRRIMLAFSMAIRLQWVIGIVFLIVMGSATGFGFRHYWEHAVTMTVAVGLSEMLSRWKNAPANVRYRNSLLVVIAVLVLVLIGVTLLPQGWRVIPS
jgi:hypothetical protein